MKRRDDDESLKNWHPDRDHAWFAGYAPSENPEIAFVVLLEHGGSGGKQLG
jgi:penicillin-binding protein 2